MASFSPWLQPPLPYSHSQVLSTPQGAAQTDTWLQSASGHSPRKIACRGKLCQLSCIPSPEHLCGPDAQPCCLHLTESCRNRALGSTRARACARVPRFEGYSGIVLLWRPPELEPGLEALPPSTGGERGQSPGRIISLPGKTQPGLIPTCGFLEAGRAGRWRQQGIFVKLGLQTRARAI